MKRRAVITQIEKLIDAGIESGKSINIKLHFNKSNIEMTHTIESNEFLKQIGHSADSPLAPYLEKFISTFKNAPNGDKKCTK